MNSLNRVVRLLSLLVLMILCSPAPIEAQSLPNTFHGTGEVYYGNAEGGFYGIIGDDGIKYQPTNLPRKFKKEGLVLQFDTKQKENFASAFMWGTIVELSNVSIFPSNLSADERRAICVLLKRMDAFNAKDLLKLQQVDTLSKQLTKEQFETWVGNYNNYTLLYVNILPVTSSSIIGNCYYSREMINGMKLYGNMELTTMTFAITQTPQGWKLTESGILTNPLFSDPATALTDMKKKALEKYNTDNLATLWQ